jgi:hypothetical protein
MGLFHQHRSGVDPLWNQRQPAYAIAENGFVWEKSSVRPRRARPANWLRSVKINAPERRACR